MPEIRRLSATSLRRWLARAGVWLLPSVALAAPGAAQFETSLAVGHEHQSSPLVRLSLDQAVLRIDGRSRLEGAYLQFAADAMGDHDLQGAGTLALATHLQLKRSPGAPDLDFAIGSGSLLWHAPLAGGFVGLGPTLQSIHVAGDHFREVRGLQADWTLASPQGDLLALVAEFARNRHGAGFRDLDSDNQFVMLQWRREQPLAGLDALGLELGVSRDRNRFGFDDLSSRNRFVRLSLERRLFDLECSLSGMLVRSRFDRPLLPGLPLRSDLGRGVDLAAEWDGGAWGRLRADLNWANNDSRLALYEYRYRQISLSWWQRW